MRARQRNDLLEYAEGLQSLFAGEDTEAACAAACNLAEVFVMLRKSMGPKDG
jgi:hypothetical protein